MKIIFLVAVCLLLDFVKAEECLDNNITFQIFLDDIYHEEYLVVDLNRNITGSVCIDYNKDYYGLKECIPSKWISHEEMWDPWRMLCSYFQDPKSVVSIPNHKEIGKAEVKLDCPYGLMVHDENMIFKCYFTSPSMASTKDGKVIHILNNTFYPEPSVTVKDVHGGFILVWNTTVSEPLLLQNLSLYIEVTEVKIKNVTKNLPERYNTRAAESSFFIPIADNVTVDLKVYFMDNFKRRSPPFFKYNLTKEFIEEPKVILKVSMIVLSVVLIGLFWYAWRHKSNEKESITESNDRQIWHNERHNPMYFRENKHIKQSELQFIKKIGEGHFGEVCLMKWKPAERLVAVKKLKGEIESDTERTQYINEIEIFKKVGSHPNVVQMLGYNTDDRPWFIVLEYIDLGDLLEYLHRLRFEFEKSRKALRISDYGDNYIASEEIESFPLQTPTQKCILPSKDMESFGRQIALGMEHLEHCGVVHRDLAARNILLTKEKIIKITDFGLSREHSYVNFRTAEMPIKWMAPETFIDQNPKCLSKSDVWSFGIVLWEIGTLGGSPYEGMKPAQLIGFLNCGRRLEKPEAVKDSLYALMMKCWEYDYQRRPTFKEIVQEFDKMCVYFELSDLKPDYIFPPH